MVTNIQPPEPGFESLAEGIIMQACTDYFYCLLFAHAPHSNAKDVNTVLIEKFFQSEYFSHICPSAKIDGDTVIEVLREAANKAEHLRYFTRKLKRNGWEVYELADPAKDLHLRFEKVEDANAVAAKMNGISEWQYNIAMTGRTEYYRKRKWKGKHHEEQG